MRTGTVDTEHPHRAAGAPARVRGWVGASHWKQVINGRVALARDDLAALRGLRTKDAHRLDRAAELLDAAEDMTRPRRARLERIVWGGAIDRAFSNLHAALILLARCAPEEELDGRLLSAMAKLRATMPPTEERRSILEDGYAAAASGSPRRRNGCDAGLKRWVLVKALEWSYGASDAQYARLRSFRNIVLAMSLMVVSVVVGLTIMGALWPETLDLCFQPVDDGRACPTGSAPDPRGTLLVAALGATGGAMAAVGAVRKMRGTSTPYSVPMALALLKLPFGALSAVLGLLLIHGRFIPGLTDLDTPGQILAYAIFLGIAQQAVTTLVDRRGQELLEHLPTKRTHGDQVGDAPPPGEEARPQATTPVAPQPENRSRRARLPRRRAHRTMR